MYCDANKNTLLIGEAMSLANRLVIRLSVVFIRWQHVSSDASSTADELLDEECVCEGTVVGISTLISDASVEIVISN